jgi:hypothetical protein
VARCPTNEALTYLQLRAAELGKGSLVGDLTPNARAEWRLFAENATVQFPNSARILTIGARATGSVDMARRAVAADSAYVPATVALASNLIAANDAANASTILNDFSSLERTSDGFAVLARARLAINDLPGALKAAQQQLTKRRPELTESDAGNPWPNIDAHETAAFAALGLKRFDDAAKHALAANFGSTKVRDLLGHPPPELRRALQKARVRRTP